MLCPCVTSHPSRHPIECEKHPERAGRLVRLVGVRGLRIVACPACIARMAAEGYTVREA